LTQNMLDVQTPLKHKWKIKEDIERIENCPLPENEVFMRTEDAL